MNNMEEQTFYDGVVVHGFHNGSAFGFPTANLQFQNAPDIDKGVSTACIITFIGGIQLLCLGIIGKYLATVYQEVKKRPHFIISETSREDAKKIG